MAPSRIPPRRRSTWVALPVLIAAASSPFTVRGATELTLERVGHWGGCSNDIQIVGDQAYVAIGPRVVVLDISSPDEPTFLGHSEPLPNVIMDLFVVGPFAYAEAHMNGLHILDVSDSQNITLLGSDAPGFDGRCVIARNGCAYVGDFDEGLRVYDVFDPAAPVLLKTVPTSEYPIDLAANKQYLYVDAWYGIDIFDVSVPQIPVPVGGMPGGYWEVEHDGMWLYAIASDRLDIWDVSEPNQPVLIGDCTADDLDNCSNLAVSNGYAYAASSWRVHTVDVREPAECVYHGWVPVGGWPHAMTATDDALYVANWYYGLVTFDLSVPEEPVEIGHYDEAVIAHSIGMHNDHVYLTGYRDEVQIIDISSPENPTRHGQQELGMSGMHVVEDMAYIINVRPYDDQGLKIAYFNDNDGLDFISNTPLPENPNGIDVEGDFAYVTIFDTGLFIIDVSVPEAPVIRGTCLLDAPTPMRVAVRFPYAYVTAGSGGVWYVVDVSDHDNPFHVKTLDNDGPAESILVEGDRLYLGRMQGFDIYSLIEPDNPALLGQFRQSGLGYIKCMIYRDDRLYISPGLSVVDVSNPADPRLLGTNVYGSRLAKDIELQGRYVLAAHNASGLSVFKIRLIADLDDDGDVDEADLSELLDRYGTCAGDPDYSESADFDGDGCINLSDLAELLSHYGNQL